MADDIQPLNDLDRLTQDIISRFETALNVSTTAELTTLVDNINKSLEEQAKIISDINVTTSERIQKSREEILQSKEKTAALGKQAQIYSNILSINDDISENWENIIKQSGAVNKNYNELNKNAKKYLATLNATVSKEKQLTALTTKRAKMVAGQSNKSSVTDWKKVAKKKGVSQFLNVDGLISRQISLESLSGGKPYFASHPELGVPVGLFNTKDEPNRAARIKSIKKYGTGGSINAGMFPQYASIEDSLISPTRTKADASQTMILIGLKVLQEKTKELLGPLAEIIDLANSFGDKVEEYSAKADEAIKSTIQHSGVLMTRNWGEMFDGETPLTRAAYFQDAMQQAAIELVVDEGINVNYEELGDLQKAFTDYSKTNVLLGKKDLKNLIYLQRTFDIAASDLGEIQGAFIDLGMSSEDLMTYVDDLATNARDYGVNATELLNETAKLIKLGAAYRFKGGVKDMQKMQVYAANAKFDIEKAYNVMDKTLSIEGAIDLASQLQVLGGEFSSINSMDLFTASVSGDWESFTNQIIEKFRRDSGRFGKIGKDGMFEFTAQGRLLLDAFNKIEGFDLGENIEEIVKKAGKEEAIRQQILSGVNRGTFLNRSKEEQDKIVQNIAQGSVKELNLTGKDLINNEIDFATMVFDNAASTMVDVNKETALGGMSVKDVAEKNKELVEIQSQTRFAFDKVSAGLLSLKDALLLAGDTIYDLGLSTFESPFYRAMNVMTETLGLSTEEAILMHKWFLNSKPGDNPLSGGLKALMDYAKIAAEKIGAVTKGAADFVTADSEVPTANPNYVEPTGSLHFASGGVIPAKGGLVMGPSHAAGGVRGTGMFGNIEVEGNEAIINKNSTQKFLPLLSKLNELGGGKAFVSNSDHMLGGFKNLSGVGENNKTIHIKLNGTLKYSSNIVTAKMDLYELAEKIENITGGQSYSGVR